MKCVVKAINCQLIASLLHLNEIITLSEHESVECETYFQKSGGPCDAWCIYSCWVYFYPVSCSWPVTRLFQFWENGSYCQHWLT